MSRGRREIEDAIQTEVEKAIRDVSAGMFGFTVLFDPSMPMGEIRAITPRIIAVPRPQVTSRD